MPILLVTFVVFSVHTTHTHLALASSNPMRQAPQAIVPRDDFVRFEELLRKAIVHSRQKRGAGFLSVLEKYCSGNREPKHDIIFFLNKVMKASNIFLKYHPS